MILMELSSEVKLSEVYYFKVKKAIDMGRKVRALLCPFPWGGRLGRGLPPYHVASWSTQLFGHNTPTSKIGQKGQADRQRSDSIRRTVFTARRNYASAVLGIVILSVRLSVSHTRALWLIQRTYRRYLYSTWKGNPSSQMWFFVYTVVRQLTRFQLT